MEIITRNPHLRPFCQHRKTWLFRVVCVLALLCHSLRSGCVSDTIPGRSLPHCRRDWGSGVGCDVTRRPHQNQLSKCCCCRWDPSQSMESFHLYSKAFFLWLFCLTCVPEFWPALSPLMGKFEGPRLTRYHWLTKELERWSPHARCGCWTWRPLRTFPWTLGKGSRMLRINSFICLVLVWPSNYFSAESVEIWLPKCITELVNNGWNVKIGTFWNTAWQTDAARLSFYFSTWVIVCRILCNISYFIKSLCLFKCSSWVAYYWTFYFPIVLLSEGISILTWI